MVSSQTAHLSEYHQSLLLHALPRSGNIDRVDLKDKYVIIGKDLFKKETDMSLFTNLKVLKALRICSRGSYYHYVTACESRIRIMYVTYFCTTM